MLPEAHPGGALGYSNLVLRATQDGDNFAGGLISGNWRGIGTTW